MCLLFRLPLRLLFRLPLRLLFRLTLRACGHPGKVLRPVSSVQRNTFWLSWEGPLMACTFIALSRHRDTTFASMPPFGIGDVERSLRAEMAMDGSFGSPKPSFGYTFRFITPRMSNCVAMPGAVALKIAARGLSAKL